MRDTTLPHQMDWDSPHVAHGTTRTPAEHRSARALWGLIALTLAMAAADTLTTWLRLSTAASQHVPAWRLEWNPLMAAVIHTYGFAGALVWQVGTAVLVVGLLPLIWRIQWSEDIRGTASQDLVRRIVLGAALLCCLARGVVTGSNLSILLVGGAFPPPSSTNTGAIPGAAATATANALATSAAPTASPTRTPAAAPTATRTATPVPASLTVDKTTVNPCPDDTFKVTYTGNVSPVTLTVTSTDSHVYRVSINGGSSGGTANASISSGTPATVTVLLRNFPQNPVPITVSVPGAPQQTVMANTNGGGCGGG